jgi:hypothetical protein
MMIKKKEVIEIKKRRSARQKRKKKRNLPTLFAIYYTPMQGKTRIFLLILGNFVSPNPSWPALLVEDWEWS